MAWAAVPSQLGSSHMIQVESVEQEGNRRRPWRPPTTSFECCDAGGTDAGPLSEALLSQYRCETMPSQQLPKDLHP